jgi:uncharacterized protein YigA (DUF484 family)
MLQRLRAEVERLKTVQAGLVQTRRADLAFQTRIHGAVLSVICARSFEHLLQTIATDLTVILDLDIATLCIESELERHGATPLPGISLLAPGKVAELLGDGRDVLVTERCRGNAGIFGNAAGLVRSQALLRLDVGARAPPGLMALGARRPARFRAGQGTEALAFLADAVELSVAQWLRAER